MKDLHNKSAISKSGLDKIQISPLDYWHTYVNPNRHPYEPDEKKIFEMALKCAVFTPRLFTEKYLKMPSVNKRTNIGKSEIESIEKTARVTGKKIISAENYTDILEMQKRLLAHPIVKVLISSGMIGQPTRFEEKNTGAIIKFLPDFISTSQGTIVLHLSSCSSASTEWFVKELANQKLHKRAAIQLDGTGAESFVFINIERKEPYKIALHYLDDRTIGQGRSEYIKNCETYVECLNSGKWPGITEKIVPASLPDWYFKSNNR